MPPAPCPHPLLTTGIIFVGLRRRVNGATDGFAWRMDLRQVFVANLRRLRHAKGLSQEDLAYEAEANRSSSLRPSLKSSPPNCSGCRRVARGADDDTA